MRADTQDTGRFNWRQIVGAFVVILCGAGVFVHFERNADQEAEASLAGIFHPHAEPELVVFNRKSAKGQRTQQVEGIYAIKTDILSKVSLQGASFRFKTSDKVNALQQWTINRFEVVDGALEWKPLPRQFNGENYFPT